MVYSWVNWFVEFTIQVLNIFETSLRRGKFDESRVYDLIFHYSKSNLQNWLWQVSLSWWRFWFRLPDGSLMEIAKVYPLDAVYDNPEDVPEDVILTRRISPLSVLFGQNCSSCFYIVQVKTNKRYAGSSNWTVKVLLSPSLKSMNYWMSIILFDIPKFIIFVKGSYIWSYVKKLCLSNFVISCYHLRFVHFIKCVRDNCVRV